MVSGHEANPRILNQVATVWIQLPVSRSQSSSFHWMVEVLLNWFPSQGWQCWHELLMIQELKKPVLRPSSIHCRAGVLVNWVHRMQDRCETPTVQQQQDYTSIPDAGSSSDEHTKRRGQYRVH